MTKARGVLVKHLIEELKRYDGNSRCMVWIGNSVGFAGLYLDGQGDDPNDPVEFSIVSEEEKIGR